MSNNSKNLAKNCKYLFQNILSVFNPLFLSTKKVTHEVYNFFQILDILQNESFYYASKLMYNFCQKCTSIILWTNAWIMSFQQAVDCWNWCWISNYFCCCYLLTLADFEVWSFISFEIRHPFKSDFDHSWKLKRNQTNTSFNIQQPVEMTWCTHKSFDYFHLTIIIS